MFTPDFIELVKKSVSIVSIAEQYLGELKPVGKTLFMAPCPFHQESKPSLAFYTEPNIYVCFGCGKRGDVISFVQEIEHINFNDAISKLAAFAKIPCEQSSTSTFAAIQARRLLDSKRRREYMLTPPVLGWILAGMNEQVFLAHQEEAIKYMALRGIEPETVKRFDIGYAPNDYPIHNMLSSYSTSQLEESSVIFMKNNEIKPYFRERVMIPFYTKTPDRDRLIAFTGRSTGPQEPKYLHSRTNTVWSAGGYIWGLQDVVEGPIILVEGPMDRLTLVQTGFPNVCAWIGSTYQDSKFSLLAGKTVIVLFDRDPRANPGESFVAKAKLAHPESDVSWVQLPIVSDPDTFVQKNGADSLWELLSQWTGRWKSSNVQRDSTPEITVADKPTS